MYRLDELELKVKEFLSEDVDSEESPEEIRKKLYEELGQNKSGWTENTVGFSLNEIRRD